jgi:hypothetical protein
MSTARKKATKSPIPNRRRSAAAAPDVLCIPTTRAVTSNEPARMKTRRRGADNGPPRNTHPQKMIAPINAPEKRAEQIIPAVILRDAGADDAGGADASAARDPPAGPLVAE